jgi:hypothetical protein
MQLPKSEVTKHQAPLVPIRVLKVQEITRLDIPVPRIQVGKGPVGSDPLAAVVDALQRPAQLCELLGHPG